MISMLINQWEYHFVAVTFYSYINVCIWLTINPSYYYASIMLSTFKDIAIMFIIMLA